MPLFDYTGFTAPHSTSGARTASDLDTWVAASAGQFETSDVVVVGVPHHEGGGDDPDAYSYQVNAALTDTGLVDPDDFWNAVAGLFPTGSVVRRVTVHTVPAVVDSTTDYPTA